MMAVYRIGGIFMKSIFKGIMTFFIVTTILMSNISFSNAKVTSYIQESGVILQALSSNYVDGKVKISGIAKDKKIKILVSKDTENTWFDVKMKNGQFDEELWLTQGTGKYTISVMINQSGKNYIYGPTINVENTKNVNKFLVPTKDIESNNSKIIKISKQITKNAKSDREKIKKIYNWVVANINYDYAKYKKQLNNNFENKYGALNTLEKRKGVCYDYSCLVAALGRAQGIMVKVVNGDYKTATKTEFHAWNEVYLSEEDKWINVDATFGNSINKNYFDNANFTMDHIKLAEY